MSDPTIQIIANVSQVVALAAIAAALKYWQDRNHADSVKRATEMHEDVTQRIETVHQDVAQKIEVVREDVNGKMAKLLQVTGESEKAKGVIIGHEEAKAEGEAVK